ncbi:MAG: F0F1 ATP synthase subunit A [Mycoplasmataceae bacterium]|nr:F0F1 ATP synthase subunit A [Mycoplasmataceae bacterium]
MEITVDIFEIGKIVPHFWATIWVTIILTGLSLFTFFFYKKRDSKKRPGVIQSTVESGFESWEKTMEDIAGPRLRPAFPYFFTLMLYIFLSASMEVFGFVNPAGSIAFTLALGLITFIGIYVIGIFTQGFIQFVKTKYVNPLEIISQFSPLISISIRLFGAVFAGSILGAIVTIIITTLGASDPVLTSLPLINIFWSWTLTGVTLFFAGLQAMVFTLLTMIYWNQELGDKKERKKAKKLAKTEKKKEKESMVNNYIDIK